MSENLIAASYYAPRGAERLQKLGNQIATRYLSPSDSLIGIIGEHGVGKSLLIRGIFPGLELTNDDNGVSVRPLPLHQVNEEDSYYSAHTYHLDVRFEMAFTQLGELVELIKKGIEKGKRIVVEHFDLVYPMLKINAELLIAVGEEIIITRPTVLGPFPEDLYKSIEGTAIYRKMAHSAEDLTCFILENEFGYEAVSSHSDFPRGFVIEFTKKPSFEIEELEEKVLAVIEKGIDITRLSEKAIRFGEEEYPCTGTTIHLNNSSEIVNYRINRNIYFDHLNKLYKVVGLVGEELRSHYNYPLTLDPEHFR